MYYKFKYYTIFRNYGEIGYLIYQKSPFDVDRVVNKIGAAFLAELSYEPKSIEVLAQNVLKKFVNVTYDMIYSDMACFFETLVEEGFLESANTFDECLKQNDIFSTYR